MRAAVVSVAACAALLIAGCGQPVPGGPAPDRPRLASQAPASDPEGSPSPTPSATVDPAAKRGQCFNYTGTNHLVIDSSDPFVSCALPHTARTVHVGELTDTSVMSFGEAQPLQAAAGQPGGLESLPDDLDADYTDFLTSMEATRVECVRIIDETVGATLPSGIPQATVLTTDLTGPTPEQWAAGDRWVRCNVVARLAPDAANPAERLIPLRPDLVNALDDATYRVCSLGSPDGARIPCAEGVGQEDVWLTISDLVPTPSIPWPGDPGAPEAAVLACVNVAEQAGIPAAPTIEATGRTIGADGVATSGFSADTWGTDAAEITCAVPLAQFAG